LFGLLTFFDPVDPELQFIFIANTRELAQQIYLQVFDLLGQTAKTALCVGSGNKNPTNTRVTGGFRDVITNQTTNDRPRTIAEERQQATEAQIIVGTIGKIFDFMCNSTPKYGPCIKPQYLKAICIDEFDNALNPPFKQNDGTNASDQIIHILDSIPPDAQRVFISATVDKVSLDAASNYFRPYNIDIGTAFVALNNLNDCTLKGIKQYYVKIGAIDHNHDSRTDVLMDIFGGCHISQAIVFVNSKQGAWTLQEFLSQQTPSIDASVFHSELTNQQRKDIHTSMASGKIRYLISTDIAARGLDIHGINLVVNYDMPKKLVEYVHRVGRSGRYGKIGTAISFIFEETLQSYIKQIKDHSTESEITELPRDLSKIL